MPIGERLRRLTRLAHPRAWRFLLLVATDPSLDRLYWVLNRSGHRELMRDPYPRFATRAVDFLEERIAENMAVLEWGAGSSTVWFARRGCTVHAIEHEPSWQGLVSREIKPPSRVTLMSLDGKYTAPVESLSPYDVVVVDGRRREDCIRFVLDQMHAGKVKPRVIVVFDDAHRGRYRGALELLRSVALEWQCFSGTCSEVLDKQTVVCVVGHPKEHAVATAYGEMAGCH
jgi:hypothetical protein